MKKIYLLLYLLMAFQVCLAQQVKFEYDNAGNRKLRRVENTNCTTPPSPIISMSAGSTVCAVINQTVTLSANASTGTVTWYKDAVAAGTGLTLTVSEPGNYTATCKIDVCESAASSIIAVAKMSNCGDVVNPIACSGFTFSEGQIIGVNGRKVVVKIESGSAVAYWQGSNERVNKDWLPLLTGKTIPDNILSTCLKWDGDVLNCASPPSVPTINKTSGSTVCSVSNQTVTLTASGCSGTVSWFKDGVQVGSGATITVNTAGNYTAKCTTGSCTSDASGVISVAETAGCGSAGSVSCSGVTFTEGQVIGATSTNAVIRIESGSAVVYWQGSNGRVNKDWLPLLTGKTISDAILLSCLKWDGDVLNCPSPPSAPSIAKTSGTTVCGSPSQTVTLTATGSGTISWYKDGVYLGTGVSITRSDAGTYTATSTVSGCVSSLSQGIVVTSSCISSLVPTLSIWKAGPSGVRVKVQDLENGNQIQKSVFGGGQANWFVSSSGQVSNSGGTNYYDKVEVHLTGPGGLSGGWGPEFVGGGDGGPYGVYSRDEGIVPVSGSYTMIGKLFSGSTELGSKTVTFSIVDNPLCAVPTINKTSGSTVCSVSNQTVTLTASGCSGTVSWFKDGVQVGSGATITVNTAGNYTAKCTTGSCTSDASGVISVAETAGCGSAGSVSCSGVTFTEGQVIGATSTNAVIRIESGSAVVYWQGSNGRVNKDWLPLLTGKTISDAILLSCLKWDGDVLNCPSPPSAPSIAKTSGTTVCGSPSQTVTLTATGSGTISWYKDGVYLGTGVSITRSDAGTYTATSTVSGCVSSLSQGIVVTSSCISSLVPTLSIWKAGPSGVRVKVQDLENGNQIQKSVFGGGQANWFVSSSGQVSNSGGTNYYDKVEVHLTGPGGLSGGWGPEFVGGGDGGPYGVYSRDEGIVPVSGSYTMIGKLFSGSTELGSKTVTFSIVDNPLCAVPTISKTSGSTVCSVSNQTVTLTASGCSGTVSWFKDGVQVGSGATITVNMAGNYTAKCTTGSCTSDASGVISVAETAGCGSAGSVSCSGVTFTEGQVIGATSTNAVIRIESGSAVVYWQGSNGRVNKDWLPLLTGKTISDAILLSCLKWDGDVLNCPSPPSAPSIAKTSGTTVCGSPSQTVTLTATGSGTISWYKDGVYLGTGVSITRSDAGTYTATSTVSGCVSSLSQGIVVTSSCVSSLVPTLSIWKAGPSGVRVKVQDLENGNQIQKSVFGGGQANWFVSSSGQVSNSGGANYYDKVEVHLTGPGGLSGGWGPEFVGGGDGGPYGVYSRDEGIVPVSGSYTMIGKLFSGSTELGSKTVTFSIVDNPLCAVPTISKTSGSTVCSVSNQTVTLTASGCSGTVSWFKDGVQVGSGATITVNTAGNYTAKCTTGSCTSDASGVISVAETAGCGSAGSVSCSGVTFTEGQVIGATSTNVVIRIVSACAVAYWQGTNDRVNKDWLPHLTGKTIPDNILSTCVKWDGEALDCSGCPSPPSAPSIAKTSGTTVCGSPSQTVTLTATGSGTISWYKDGVYLGTGVSITRSDAGTYTATSTVSGCVSSFSQGIVVTSGCVSSLVPTLSIWKAGPSGVRVKVQDLENGNQIQKSVFGGGQANWFVSSSGQVSNPGGANYYDKVQLQLSGPNGIGNSWGPDPVGGGDGGPYGAYNRDGGVTPISGNYTMTGKLFNGSNELGSKTVSFTIVGDDCVTPAAPTFSTNPTSSVVCPATNTTTYQSSFMAVNNTGGALITWYKDGIKFREGGSSLTTDLPGSYTATVSNGSCVSAHSVAKVLTLKGNCDLCYEIVVASNEKRLSNHNGIVKVKDEDGSASQAWKLQEDPSGYIRIVSKGSTNGSKVNYALGTEIHDVTTTVELFPASGMDSQMWMKTQLSEDMYKFEMKDTPLRMGSTRGSWGSGILNDSQTDIELVYDPGNVYGAFKWKLKPKVCPASGARLSAESIIPEVSDIQKMQFYPNPVADRLYVNVRDLSTLNKLEIFNVSGLKVLGTAKITSGGIDMAKLSQGTYLIKVTFKDGRIETYKVAKD